MKTAIVLVLVLVSILLVECSTCSVQNLEPALGGDKTIQSNQPSAATNSNFSPTYDKAETGSRRLTGSFKDQPAMDTDNMNETIMEEPAQTRTDQNMPSAPGEQIASPSVPPPDGRVFTGGDAPYAYIPTSSLKEKRLPIIPLTPGE